MYSPKSYKNDFLWELRARKLGLRHSNTDFNSASVGSPMEVASAGMRHYRRDKVSALGLLREEAEATRTLVAEILNTNSSNIYFHENTTYAMKDILGTIRFQEGDRIITTSDEYGSISHTIDVATRHGRVEVNIIGTGCDLASRIRQEINERTRLIVTSHITHDTCKVLPVADISYIAREGGIPYFVDAAQSIGHIPVDAQQIDPDALVGCGHKWLRGETTTGILYLSDRMPEMPFMHVPFGAPIQKRDTEVEKDMLDYNGPVCAYAIAHLGMALRQHRKFGWNNKFRRVEYLGNIVREELAKVPGVELIQYTNSAPGMVVFRVSRFQNQANAQERLEKEFNIVVGFKDKLNILRVSTSPFNTIWQIRRLRKALESIAQ
ncbi:aminotransferase class V-fold PLP-dependent enzyme [Candidatus Woesearchaeota archaeon]|nr:aminotransferase class V-fold PLP-dependent enzyme [Candidatus Woesearchaeota archaeon]